MCVLDEARAIESCKLREELNEVKKAVIALSDILNESAPLFPEETVQVANEEFKQVNPSEIFECDEDREFYLNLPVLEENKEHNKDIKDRFEVFRKKLSTCASKNLADHMAEDFIKISNKKNRKDLIDILCNYSKHTMQCLPFFARMVAQLGVLFKEIPHKIIGKLENEFNHLQEQGDPSSLDIRIRNLKFVSEFLKFQLAQPLLLLNCFELCLSNFSGENIRIACQVLHSCGRYLSRHPMSTERMNLMVNRMQRLKDKKNLPTETANMIDEAIFTCRPKEKLKKKKNISILFEFIKFEMLSLNAQNTQEKIRILQQCPMPESEIFLVKSVLIAIKKGKVSNLSSIAKLLAGLKNSPSFTEAIVLLVDITCEDILLNLKLNDFRKSQQRVLMIKFFGELHCYNIISHGLVFKMLFFLLTSTTDTFKVKLIWALLDTVKDFFSNPQYKLILKSFLTEFKRYILSKPGISIELEFLVMDLLEMFRSQKLKPNQVESPVKDIESLPIQFDEVDSSSSNGENSFDLEFEKLVEEETKIARLVEGAKEKEIPTIFSDGNNSGFKVLIKKAGKVQAKNIVLPDSDPLVKCSEERSKTQAAEREKLSRVVVDLHQRRLLEENK